MNPNCPPASPPPPLPKGLGLSFSNLPHTLIPPCICTCCFYACNAFLQLLQLETPPHPVRQGFLNSEGKRNFISLWIIRRKIACCLLRNTHSHHFAYGPTGFRASVSPVPVHRCRGLCFKHTVLRSLPSWKHLSRFAGNSISPSPETGLPRARVFAPSCLLFVSSVCVSFSFTGNWSQEGVMLGSAPWSPMRELAPGAKGAQEA